MTIQSKSARFAKLINRNKNSHGYELFAFMNDGGILCNKCTESEYKSIATTDGRDGWNIIAIASTDAYDDTIFCDHCGRIIGE